MGATAGTAGAAVEVVVGAACVVALAAGCGGCGVAVGGDTGAVSAFGAAAGVGLGAVEVEVFPERLRMRLRRFLAAGFVLPARSQRKKCGTSCGGGLG